VSNSAWIVNSDVTVYHADRWFSWRDCEPIASRCALLLQRPITRAEWHLQHRHRHSQCNAVAVYAAAAIQSIVQRQIRSCQHRLTTVIWCC